MSAKHCVQLETVFGSTPIFSAMFLKLEYYMVFVAQLGERLTVNQEVVGSKPTLHPQKLEKL